MEFGTMNEYRPLKHEYRLGMPYRVSRGDDREWVIRAIIAIGILAVAILAATAV